MPGSWSCSIYSNVSAAESQPWDLANTTYLELWQHYPKMHFSGVCFGHQLLCRLLGAKVAPAPSGDWELGHRQISLNPIGKKLFRTDDDEIHLQQMHQDQVVSPPTVESSSSLLEPGAKVEVWGYSDHTAVQGIYVQNRLFTTQAHMAFDDKMVKTQIEMRMERGSIEDKDHADQAAETADLEHDGDRLAMAILRFFHFEDDGIE
jgi:GMP synthase-like glutamine amidotransferase